jgi:hypothetical protein
MFCGGEIVVSLWWMRDFCGALCGGFALLKICQLFEIYFWDFPFWEADCSRFSTGMATRKDNDNSRSSRFAEG